MPLKKGASEDTIGENIEELAHGPHADERTHAQDVAIAIQEARKTGDGHALRKFMAKYGKGSK